MSKGPKIRVWVKSHIYTEARMNPAEPRDHVAEKIEKYLEGKEPIPSRDTLNKMISSARNSNDFEDNLWTVATLGVDNCDIPPEALPVVMNAWAKALVADVPLTIRQVKWVARLSYILGDMDKIILRASEYASREKAIQLNQDYQDKPQMMSWLWFADYILYDEMSDEGKDEDVTMLIDEIYRED